MQFFLRSRKARDMIRSAMTPPPFLKSAPKAQFSSVASQWEGGVSMVQGASRGIGLEFARQLLEKSSKGHVVATCRNPSAATGLLELKVKFEDRLKIIPLDVTDESSIEAAAISIKSNYGSLNLLINTSGVLSIPKVLHPGNF